MISKILRYASLFCLGLLVLTTVTACWYVFDTYNQFGTRWLTVTVVSRIEANGSKTVVLNTETEEGIGTQILMATFLLFLTVIFARVYVENRILKRQQNIHV